MKRILSILLVLEMLSALAVTVFADTWTCQKCGEKNTGEFCSECGAYVSASADEGQKMILKQSDEWFCLRCGAVTATKFCTGCGEKRSEVPYDVGNIVTMGYYGGEAVEWLVLAAEGDTRTLIAVKGQEAVCFNVNKSDGNDWETSYIRAWLNETYYNEAFSAEEQDMIIAGPTGDRVWLLSADEACTYFVHNAARICYPSAYAKKYGASTNSDGAGWWWLRSPGSSSDYAAIVLGGGGVISNGLYVVHSYGVARPVVVVSVGLLLNPKS